MADFFIFIKEQRKVELIFSGDKRIYGIITSFNNDQVVVVTEQKINPKLEEYVEVNIYSENGVYSGSSRLLEFKSENRKRYFTISYPKEIRPTQRREYLRADLKIPFKLTSLNKDEPFEINGETHDICGKGVSFVSDKSISYNTKYMIYLKFKNMEILSSCQLVYTRSIGINRILNACVLTGITLDDTKYLTDLCMEYHFNNK